MSLATRFIPHSVELLSGPSFIDQIESTGPEAGVSLFEESAGSEIDREFVAIKGIVPVIPIITTDLTVLTTVGMSGLATINASNSVIVYGRELPFGGVPTALATAHHLKLTCTDGLLVPVSIRGTNQQAAKLQLMLHAAQGTGGSSGATPLVRAASQAITSGAAQVSKIFTAATVKYTVAGGSARLVDGIVDINTDFGIQVFKEGSGSQIYQDHLSIISRMPRIEFQTSDVALITEIGEGIAISAFAAYYQKTAPNGVDRVAKATTAHLGITGTSGVIVPGTTALTHKQAGHSSFTFYPAKDTVLLTISAAAAIPTT